MARNPDPHRDVRWAWGFVVLIVAGGILMFFALFGDLMVTQAEAAKLGGFVVDAASRILAAPETIPRHPRDAVAMRW